MVQSKVCPVLGCVAQAGLSGKGMAQKADKRSGPKRPYLPEVQLDLFDPVPQAPTEQPICTLPWSNNKIEMCGDRWVTSGSPWINEKEQ